MAAEKMMDRENAEKATASTRRGPRLPWPILAVNFTLMMIILIGGFLYTRQQISQIQIDKKNELRAIAALKTSQIRHWLDKILDDGRFLRSTMNNNARFIKKLKIKPDDFNVAVSEWLKAFKDFLQFTEIYFLDRQSRSVWLIAERAEPADPRLAGELQADFDAREVSISDLYFSKVLQRIALSLRVPIGAVPAAGNGLQAMLLLSIDPGRSLFPLIQSWPTASPSAETLLVRREGDEVIYLNELRHRQNTALRLGYPLAKNETPAAQAARGKVGFVTGPDYRGIQVLADIHRVPGTSWSLIAKIDQEEVRLLVARQQWVMFALVFSVFLLILLFSAYFWRRQQVSFLRRQVTSAAALQESENRYRLLIENQGEGIGLVDTADRFIFANPAGDEIFGVQPGMLVGRSLNEFLQAADRDDIRLKTTSRPSIGKESYEINIIRPDGKERILQVTVTPRFAESGHYSGAFGIFRDISERKQAEKKLRFFALAVESSFDAIGMSTPDGRHYYQNRAFNDLFGNVGENPPATLYADEQVGREVFRAIMGGNPWIGEVKMKAKAGELVDILLSAYSIKDDTGKTLGLVGVHTNITERKRDEEIIKKMLAEKELLLKEVHHRVKNNMMVIGSLLDLQVERVSDPQTVSVLQESRNRIHAMLTIYEKLYRATDLTHIGLDDYFSELARSLFAAYNIRPGAIELETAIDDIELDINQTIPCGLIINELVSNTLKYAFPGDRKGRIRIEFGEIAADNGRGTACRAPNEETDIQHDKGTARRAPTYALTVANDGVPLPAGFDCAKSTGFGLQLVFMLAGQLGGKLQAHSREWTEFQVIFPKNLAKTGGTNA